MRRTLKDLFGVQTPAAREYGPKHRAHSDLQTQIAQAVAWRDWFAQR